MEKHAHPPRVVYCAIYSTRTRFYKIASLKFAYLLIAHRYITSPSEKTRPESWHGNYMSKAIPVWQFSLSHRCNHMKPSTASAKSRRWKSMLIHQGWFTALFTHDVSSLKFALLHVFKAHRYIGLFQKPWLLTTEPLVLSYSMEAMTEKLLARMPNHKRNQKAMLHQSAM